MDNDDQTSNSLFAGEALQQSGTFTNASLSGTSIVYNTAFSQNSPPSNPSTTNTLLATITIPSSGNFNFFGYQIDQGSILCAGSGTAPSCTSEPGTYTVDSTGRVLLGSGGGSHSPVFYMVSANQAFFLGSSPGVESGMLLAQSSTAAPSGTFAIGTIDIVDANADINSGVAILSGTPLSLSITSDDNSAGSLSPDQPIGPYTVAVDSTGLGTVPSGCTIATSTGTSTCKLIFYVVSPTKAVLMGITGENSGTVHTNPNIIIADQ
jgi:hypothetical protein